MYLDYILKAVDICKEYKQGSSSLKVVNHLDLEIKKKDAICIKGPSGAGKSTFLHILGTLDNATSGSVFYKNKNLSLASDQERARFRRDCLGFVFQFHYLLSEFNAIENIMIAGQIAGDSTKKARSNARDLMQMLDLEERRNHFPSEMSGGEQQRVAVARALMNNPEILLVDEPTGNLDTKNSTQLLNILLDLRQRLGITLIAVSHDSQFSEAFPQVLQMKDGKWVNQN